MINKVGTPQQKEILSAAEKGTAMPATRPISKDVEDIKKMQAASRERQGVKESYDAYDLVLEYLLSQGHAETVEEANYVMLVMDAKTIGTIVEGSGIVTGTAGAINKVIRPINQTPEQAKTAVSNITRSLDVVAKPIKSILSPVNNSQDAQNQRMNKRRP
jgi:hypothetical protein